MVRRLIWITIDSGIKVNISLIRPQEGHLKMVSAPVWILIACAGLAAVFGQELGGQETSIDRYPSIAQVDTYSVFTSVWSHSCAANILTSRYVLGAAHCFAGILYQPQYRRIRAGTTFRNTGGQLVYVEREFNHPSYGQLGNDGDITVVLLSTGLVYNPVVQAGSIVSQGWQVPDNSPVVHAGWGATSQGGLTSAVLLEGTIYTINRDTCRDQYQSLLVPGVVTNNMICAGLPGIGGRDACQGDSGGPFYYGNIIIGVVSWGYGCTNNTFPVVGSAVSSYTNWILATAI